MDFQLTDDQKMIRDTAASFVKKGSPVERMRKLRDDARGWDPAVWAQMGELGWLGLPFPETVGGFGGSLADAAILLEQFGTTLVPEPYIPSVILGGMALSLAGSVEQQTKWLAPMIEGKTSLALAHGERQGRYDTSDVATRATKDGDGWRLDGEKVWVLNGHAADALIVVARTAGERTSRAGLSLFVVPRDLAGVAITPVRTMDGAHAAIVRFEGAKLGADALLGEAGTAADVVERVLDLGAAAACAEGVGIVSAVLAMTVEYLRTRKQFGVAIGVFQALQHRAVDMFVQVELCKSTSLLSALRAGAEPHERARAVSIAKTQLATGGFYVTAQAIQLHGGIGVTDEHDVGLYFKRMRVLNALFGDEQFHVERFARLPAFMEGVG